MVKTRRLVIAAAALTVTALALSACSSSAEPSDSSSSSDVTGTLRILATSFPASAEGEAAFQTVVDTFHETYPNVEVEPDFATFANLNEKISTSIAGGQGYDVIVSGVGWIPPFASKGLYTDLADFGVTSETLAETSTEAIIPAVTYDGAVYAYPLVLGAKPLAFSRSAFEAAGLDPDNPPDSLAELADYAEKLTVRDASGKITRAGFDFWAGSGEYRQDFTAILGALGRDLYEDGAPGFDGKEGVEALEFIDKLVNDEKVIEFGQKSASGAPLLYTGEAAIGFAGGYIDCEAVTQAVCDDLVFFNLEDERQAMFSGGQLASITSTSKLQDASWAFVQALSTPEALASIASLNFAVPASKDAANSEIVTSNPASTFAYANLDYLVFEGGAANWLDLRNEFGTELDRALLGQATPQEVLDALASKSE